MDEVLALAAQLGRRIGGHARTKAFTDAAKAVAEDREAQSILADYQKQVERIRALEAEQKPIEVADKRRLADLESKVAGNEKLRAMMRTQADYVELVNRVHAAMDEASQAEE